MKDNTQYWADKILAIFRAYKKLLMSTDKLVDWIDEVELKRPIDAIHLCKTMPLDRAVVGYWTTDRKASTHVFVPTKYMLLLYGEDPCIWVAGDVETWPPCPKTAGLITSWKDGDVAYHAQPWTPPYDYPADELTEALLWFATHHPWGVERNLLYSLYADTTQSAQSFALSLISPPPLLRHPGGRPG